MLCGLIRCVDVRVLLRVYCIVYFSGLHRSQKGKEKRKRKGKGWGGGERWVFPAVHFGTRKSDQDDWIESRTCDLLFFVFLRYFSRLIVSMYIH